MLESYYPSGGVGSPSGITREQKQRLIAVQAALEIAKVGAAQSGTAHSLDSIVNDISRAADAIQEALKK